MTVNVNSFNQYNNYGRTVNINREWSSINMNFTIQGTGYVGYIIPIFARELIPGQTIEVKTKVGIQFVPFVSNLFHNMYGTIKYFFMPFRIGDENFVDFIMGGIDGQNNYQMPFIDLAKAKASTAEEAINQSLVHTVVDYLTYPINNDFQEIPENDTNLIKPSYYPIYAYNKVYNDHYRNPDLMPEEVELDNIQLHKCLWQFDYFTRGQVYQQRGAVPIVPLSGAQTTNLNHVITTVLGQPQYNTATPDILGSNTNTNTYNVSLFENLAGYPSDANFNPPITITDQTGKTLDGMFMDSLLNQVSNRQTVTNGSFQRIPTTNARFASVQQTIADHELNLEGTGINLNDLFTSMGIMAVLINNAKITYRYIDFLEIRYGIKRQDARLQMSEYISTQEFHISSQGITQLGYGDVQNGQTPQGHIIAQATGMGGARNVYEAQEHGIIIGMMEIKPATAYCQGLNRLLQTKTRYEFATPELSNMPDRETYTGELYYTQTEADRVGFNWTGVYNEYRTAYNTTVGLLRPDTPIPATGSTLSNGLYSYTLTRLFEEAPVFNQEFIEVNADMQRVKQYTEEPDFVFMIEHEINTSMPLPLVPNPAQLINL